MSRRGVALTAAALALSLAACGSGGSPCPPVLSRVRRTRQIVVGTKWDQPNLGLKTDAGEPQGFDADVARYLARKLAGGPDVRIIWRESPSSTREALLQNGTVDMIVASYSITSARRPKVTFGGPYVVDQQDTMVRADDPDIHSVADLRGKRICLAEGSNSYRRLVDPPPDGELGIRAVLVPAHDYSDCVQMLADHKLDAVSTENLALAGFVQQQPGRFRLLNDPISDERWGVGLKKGDRATCEAVNKAVADMWRDGTAAGLLDKWFGGSGLKLPSSRPSPVGCP
ncbi:glutamate ABC transporter substrate-binding protein [Nonomuraea jiangxiensis]|uniref:Glutamate transport system substrate-binding protein n=1 Tax=Nonomuraea jiangxiensis TaxID=633440 RepID=A0A1G7YA73_9ACTN|nr:glutamate ABC transporter substrate-binding protein [Nonomuraea jiangxiensis]SDG93351.1 glutamate transport system substrate-binding protein [Nonomuraea jiangxiensis]